MTNPLLLGVPVRLSDWIPPDAVLLVDPGGRLMAALAATTWVDLKAAVARAARTERAMAYLRETGGCAD